MRSDALKPENLLFAATHEWVALSEENGQKIATVGISEFAVKALTDLVFIELPAVGREVSAGDSFCEVESVKAVSDIYAPVSGEVVAVNKELPDHLEILSDDAYGKGWIARIRVTDESGLAKLMDFVAYQKQCEDQA